MPKALTELPDILPKKVITYARKHVSQARTDFVDYVCREHSGLLIRTYAYKCQFRAGKPLLNKLQIREILRRRTGDPGYAVRDLYRIWTGMGDPWRVAWTPTRKGGGYATQWYNANFCDDWDTWYYDTHEADRPNLHRFCINREVVREKYPYCGYPTDSGWDIIDYVSMWLNDPKIEFFGKAGIHPKKALVKKAEKDKAFAAYLMKNRKEAKYASIRLINLGYRAGLTLTAVNDAYFKAYRRGCSENAVVELLAKNKKFDEWFSEHSELAEKCCAKDLIDAYYGRLTEELAKRRSLIRVICAKLHRPKAETIDYVERTGIDPVAYKEYLECALNLHLDLEKKEVAYPETFDQAAVQVSFESELLSKVNELPENARKVLREKIAKVVDYVREQHINAAAYAAYIWNVADLGLNLTDTKHLFPRDFIRIAEEKKNELKHLRDWRKAHFREAFKQTCDTYAMYQDMPGTTGCAYCMILPFDPQDLVNEGTALQHCVGRAGYDSKVVNKKSLITFLRLSDDPETPYVTCEINLMDWSLKQCYGSQDSKPAKEVLDYAKAWVERTKKAVLAAA